eukprot:TRINITY_DN5789_c0_g2_i4.p1 TRINITY_DN5789_c0_g2~~TRINITY_DN5789_c0_g2_i4.p1  ORF type:complete len:3745 (+),score=744.53 TRINITY_DN5789_c0_g2_i4:86-11320(+)
MGVPRGKGNGKAAAKGGNGKPTAKGGKGNSWQPANGGGGKGKNNFGGKGGNNKGNYNKNGGKGGSNSGKGGKNTNSYTPPNNPGKNKKHNPQTMLKVLREAPDDVSVYNPLWMSCWSSPTLDFLEAVAKVRASATLPNPPSSHVFAGIDSFIKSVTTDNTKSLVTVINVVTKLLEFQWPDKDAKSVTSNMRKIAHSSRGLLDFDAKNYDDLSAKINDFEDTVRKSWSIKLKVTTAEETIDSAEDGRWETAQLKWLANSKIFAPTKLPSLQVESCYSSEKDYIERIEQLWVAMTFSGGNTALTPKCRELKAGWQCGNPLYPPKRYIAETCRTHNCKNDLELACSEHRRHGVCKKCFKDCSSKLRGPPGPGASTDIYDGVIQSYHQDGKLTVSHFASRNPPNVAVNWKTTARLASPNIVAVIKVTNHGDILQASDRIMWGEVMKEDYIEQERRSGRVRLDMCSVNLDFETDDLEQGTNVVLIDCKGFAPEWVPALRALQTMAKTEVPLKNGAYIGVDSESDLPASTVVVKDDITDTSVRSLVEKAVRESNLKPLVDIRNHNESDDDDDDDDDGFAYYRNDQHRSFSDKLIDDLTDLVNETTLDDMQLVSFINALCNTVHLTQGPPGTGKSYFGVALVRALIIIREYWMAAVPSVGEPPILVLSYKNHAIDEFLLDLIRCNELRNSLHSLVRFGTTQEQKLKRFSERSQWDNKEVIELKEKLRKLQNVRKDVAQQITTCNEFILNKPDDVLKPTSDEFYNAIETLFDVFDRDGHQIQTLRDQADHYNMKDQDLVESWLLGRQLCRLCDFPTCNTICSTPEDYYCSRHVCKVQKCLRGIIENGRSKCDQHACYYSLEDKYCNETRLPPPQNYCKNHVCRRCIELSPESAANEATDLCPRNVCFDHPLCQFDDGCLTYTKDGEYFCDVHKVRPKCTETTRKGKPCPDFAISASKPWCLPHSKWHKDELIEIEKREEAALAASKTQTVNIKESQVEETEEPKAQMMIKVKQDPKENDKDANTTSSIEEPKDEPKDESKDESKDEPIDCIDTGYDLVQQDVGPRDNDEMSIITSSEEEENANAVHHRDVLGTDSENSESDDESELSAASPKGVVPEIVDDIPYSDPSNWSWDMTYDQRWKVAHLYMRAQSKNLEEERDDLAKLTQSRRKMLRGAKARCKASAFQRKVVIGGTMVGCISRLESIRALKPFAVVVEEASEVLEPLLLSCLTESTCKLEMVGDHYQLQPTVSDKFQYQLENDIGISMFERCVKKGLAPTTVLSIQRRMRPEICDFTRDYYKTITQIKDDPKCSTRLIERTQNKTVPGIVPDVFLWSHWYSSERSKVGLSKCNTKEAESVVKLVQYLHSCGVPLPSIAVLTPYSGQVRELSRLLRQARCFDKFDTNNSCRLSTVDRFQGDEADVIIASLVVDKTVRSQFVKIRNRMIVLLSRARIGMYILGNNGYFEGTSIPEHWKNTFEMLQNPLRVGHALPLCCIEHPTSTKDVSDPSMLNQTFCKVVCSSSLRCGHECGNSCHALRPKDHKKNCDFVVASTCPDHVKDYPCHQFMSHCTSKGHLNDARPTFQCPELMNFTLPCTHIVNLECYKVRKIVSDEMPLPKCNKTAVSPFIIPGCGHPVTCTCTEYEQYTSGKLSPPRCMKKVVYSPSCSHDIDIDCFQKSLFVRKADLFVCKMKVPTKLPRCGHPVSVSCLEEIRFRSWVGTGIDNNTVREGHSYGSDPPITCKQTVTFEKKCGHTSEIKCSDAFRLARDGERCTVKTVIANPHCGHRVNCLCYEVAKVPQCDKSPVNIWDEGDPQLLQPQSLSFLSCKETVTFRRLCGHKVQTQCSKCTGRNFPKCLESVKMKSPLCGHEIEVGCTVAQTHAGFRVWEEGEEVCDNILNGNATPRSVPPELAPFLNKCDKSLNIQLECGHVREMKCSEVCGITTSTSRFVCDADLYLSCWNSERCGNENNLKVKCSHSGGLFSCTSRDVKYSCPKGHRLSMACQKGEVDRCPHCALENLSFGEFKTDTSELTMFLKSATTVDPIFSGDELAALYEKEKEVLDIAAQRAASTNLAPTPLRIPIICKVTKKECKNFNKVQSFTGIRPSMGYEVVELTASNLMAGLQPGNYLVGYASCVEAKRLTSRPNQNQFRKIREEGYRVISITDGKKETFIFWSPFPLIATHRVKFNKFVPSGYGLPATTRITLGTDVKYIRPQGKLTLRKPAFAVEPPAPKDPTTHPDRDWDLGLSYLLGTRAQTVNLPISSNGMSVSQSPAINEDTEDELMGCLKFLNPNASPFIGKRKLENLKQLSDDPMISLLLALELHHHKEDASNHLADYLKNVNKEHHPWVLLAIGRIIPGQEDVLRALVLLYPETIELLTESEKMFLGDVAPAAAPDPAAATKAANETLLSKWHSMQQDVTSPSMDELLGLCGLRKVKEEALSLCNEAIVFSQMEANARKANAMPHNYCFVGNPGTGKTTVAKLFGKIMFEAGLHQKDVFVEISASKAKDGGIDEFRKLVEKAMGGVLFIDEAYNLDPIGDFKGKPIVDELLVVCENHRHEISVILAGYEDDFNDKFFAYNDGLRSRFKTVVFEDFDKPELASIWSKMITDRSLRETHPRLRDIVIDRIHKMSGKKGFGNARTVRQYMDDAVKRAMSRPDFDPKDLQLSIADAIGDDPTSNPKLQLALAELQTMTGWERVKKTINEFVTLASTNYNRELEGKKPFPVMLNRLLLGNPGTGKTRCSAIYGEILKCLNFLSNGSIVPKTAGDFNGSVVGEAKKNTLNILAGARGKVLVIDEAYGLASDKYGSQVLDTIVEKVQGTESDDIAVLMLGYEDQMKKMLREQNPGLARRFNDAYALYFDDFTDDQLLSILESQLKGLDVKATLDFKDGAIKTLSKQRERGNFGNAGAVSNLLKAALQKGTARAEDKSAIKLTVDDLEQEKRDGDPFAVLDKLYRMQDIKQKLSDLRNTFIVADREGTALPELGHFVFTGPPGTGKTTVARAMGKALCNLKLLTSEKVVEITGLSATQSKSVLDEKLKEAKGGILFIDEAYELGSDAVTTIVAAMTSNEFKDVCIIIAGYKTDMDDMLNVNSGLKSRFTHYLTFPDWKPDDCCNFISTCCKNEGFALVDTCHPVLLKAFTELVFLKGWGNGRDVDKLWKSIKETRAARTISSPELQKTVTVSDVTEATEGMLARRRPPGFKPLDLGDEPLDYLDKLYLMGETKKKLQQLKNNLIVAKREGSETPEVGHFAFTGSPGTGKTTVARVTAEILASMNLISGPRLVETSGLSLTGEYVGQTKKKVEEKLDEAKGGVLFIDEAYELGKGTFGEEAITTLVAAMTDPEYSDLDEAKGGVLFIDEAYELGKGTFGEEAITTIVAAMTDPEYSDMVIIIAGYETDIHQMMEVNEGLKSRFTHYLQFPDWEAEDCLKFFQLRCAKKNIFLHKDCASILSDAFEELVGLKGWGNGRDVDKLWDTVLRSRAERVFDHPEPEEKHTIAPSDVREATSSFLKARRVKVSKLPSRSQADLLQQLTRMDTKPSETPVKELSKTADAPTPQPEENQSEEEDDQDVEVEAEAEAEAEKHDDATKGGCGCDHNDDDDDGRDEGVPDDVWLELKRCKVYQREQQEKLRKLEEEQRVHKEEEARRQQEHEEHLRRLKQQQMEEEARLEAIRKAEIAEHERKLALRRAEEARLRELERLREEAAKRERIQQELRKRSPCPAGFNWTQVSGGWRCGGGTHFVSDAELESRFTTRL